MKSDDTLRRLKTIEGHLRGVIRMVDEDAYCIDVIRQIQAVEAPRSWRITSIRASSPPSKAKIWASASACCKRLPKYLTWPIVSSHV